MQKYSSPRLVALIDQTGVPIFSLPSQKQLTIISGVISAILQVSEMLVGESIDYIKTQEGLIFVKPVKNVGSLLVYFEGIFDKREVEWIVYALLNEILDTVKMLSKGITQTDIEELSGIYESFQSILNGVIGIARELEEKYGIFEELAGNLARNIVEECSDGIFVFEDRKLIFNSQMIEIHKITIREIIDKLIECYHTIKEKTRKLI